jgi:hypothetical protein
MIYRQSSKLKKLKQNKIVFNAENEFKMKTYIKVKQFSTSLTSHDVNTLEQKKTEMLFFKILFRNHFVLFFDKSYNFHFLFEV